MTTKEWVDQLPSAMRRDAIMRRIREGLEKRSGKRWSVTGGRGTAYGWLTIQAPPARRKFDWDGLETSGGTYMSQEDRFELARLLGLEGPCHLQGIKVPASFDYYVEHIDRAEGRQPEIIGKPYWD